MPKSREQCAQIREDKKNKILDESVIYFAKHGLDGTKIGDLSKTIGIAQGSIYSYFDSKEDLFEQVQILSQKRIGEEEFDRINEKDVPPVRKLRYISDFILKNLAGNDMYCAYFYLAFYDQVMGRNNNKKSSENHIMDVMIRIISQGQKEGSFAKGDARKAAEYYLGVVYLYSIKKLHDPKIELLNSSELERVVRG